MLVLPEKIQKMIGKESYSTDNVGMSGSSVLLFEEKVLKIQDCNEEAENEYLMMRYLEGKLPVPAVYAYEEAGGRAYLLMGRCRGQMSCSDEYMRNPALLGRLLAEGLKRLWSVDVSDCPCDWRLDHKLICAKYNVENGLVDLDNVEADTFGEKGFADPAALLQWLYAHAPEEEPVLSHGDYCLPNVFGLGQEISGYLDLGRTGIADKWCDIALCFRSLEHNFSGKYNRSGETHPDYDKMLLFRELDLEPDWEKIRYYILLDELF